MTSEPRIYEASWISSVDPCGPIIFNAYNLSSRQFNVNGCGSKWCGIGVGKFIYKRISHIIHQNVKCSGIIISMFNHRKPDIKKEKFSHVVLPFVWNFFERLIFQINILVPDKIRYKHFALKSVELTDSSHRQERCTFPGPCQNCHRG